MRRILDERPDFVDVVRAEVEARGPMTTREVEVALAHDQPRRTDHWGWNGPDVKPALELPLLGRAHQLGRPHVPVRAPVCPVSSAPGATAASTHRPVTEANAHLSGAHTSPRRLGTELCLADSTWRDTRPAVGLVTGGERPVTVPG